MSLLIDIEQLNFKKFEYTLFAPSHTHTHTHTQGQTFEIVKVQRIDHLGIVAGVIKDLKIIEMIDSRIPKDGIGGVKP
ncbi:DUF4277 domain-containing protein [Desulfobacter sp.]|uniref:DUF4277 domain-containing protein n=1 Tax=Desulfobacter sp. TaxID=2294 RepID=UPI00338F3910